jgi:predicted nucleotide-binding protein
VQLSRRSQQKFADFAAKCGTLDQIRDVYQAHGFALAADFRPSQGRARRSVCETAEREIDPRDSSVSERLLAVYVDAIADWGVTAGGWVAPVGADEDPLAPEARAIVRSLQRDGAPIDDEGKLVVQPAPSADVTRKPAGDPSAAQTELADDVDRRAVMVVHGRNEGARRGMFTFLRALGLRPLEWGTLVAGTKKGAPYVGEVLDHAFRKAAAVVVLFTPDDEARLRESLRVASDPTYETDLTPQARPNVLFEAGMALGLHPDRTILVELGRLRPFSDVYGRHVVRLDGTERPLRDIARRLDHAGCDVDTSGDDWADPKQFPKAETEIRSGASPASTTGPTVLRDVEYLNEDARRWIADRDQVLQADLARRSNEMSSSGLLYSGAHLAALASLRRQALQEYRDEMSRKRRRYRDLCDAAPAGVQLSRFALEEGSREILSRWRADVTVPGMSDVADVDDPTDRSREPDLRKFEEEGDGC